MNQLCLCHRSYENEIIIKAKLQKKNICMEYLNKLSYSLIIIISFHFYTFWLLVQIIILLLSRKLKVKILMWLPYMQPNQRLHAHS